VNCRLPGAGHIRENIVGTQRAVSKGGGHPTSKFEKDASKLSVNLEKLAFASSAHMYTSLEPLMTYNDNSKPLDDAGQAIRRLPTGLYELSPSLQRPQPILRRHEPPRLGRMFYEALFGPIFLDETGAGWKVVRPLLVASVLVPIGIAGLVMLSAQMVATIPKPPVETKSVAAVPLVEVNSQEAGRASAERLSRGGVTDPATPAAITQPTSTVRADWLVENLAKAGQDLRLRKRASSWFPATTSPDDIDRGPQEVARSVGEPVLDFGDSTKSELRSSPIVRKITEKHKFDARRTARRGTFKSARRKVGYGSYWDRFFQPWEF
jgi:hypothetical protein